MLNECNGCEFQCKLSHIDICTLGSPCPHQRSELMTNEEWLKSCSTEELAEWFAKTKFFKGDTTVEEFVEWLRSEHE